MKIVIAMVLLLALVSAETLPDAPSTSMQPQTTTGGKVVRLRIRDGVASQLSFAERHRKAITWGGIAIGSAIGVWAGFKTKGVHCSATMYEGKPYSGTSPGCPKDEPSKARLR